MKNSPTLFALSRKKKKQISISIGYSLEAGVIIACVTTILRSDGRRLIVQGRGITGSNGLAGEPLNEFTQVTRKVQYVMYSSS